MRLPDNVRAHARVKIASLQIHEKNFNPQMNSDKHRCFYAITTVNAVDQCL